MGSVLPLSDVDRRLDRVAGMCVRGELAGAELELADWRREGDCPAEALVMVGALLARRGEVDTAIGVVAGAPGPSGPADAGFSGPAWVGAAEVLQLLISLYVARGFDDAAERWAGVLGREAGGQSSVRIWLEAMGFGLSEGFAKPQAGEVGRLAVEIANDVSLMGTLVFAQKQEPNRESIALLRAALAEAEPGFQFTQEHAQVCLALGELALLAEDYAEARRWAQRGLTIEPMSAPLAMVLNQATDDATAPAAAKALGDVLAKFPNYADVHAALIRREAASGQRRSAERRLSAWLEREPGSHVARGVQRELAA